MSARGIKRPVGLFGLVRNSSRVCGPMAARIRVGAKGEIRPERHFHDAGAGARRGGRIHVERRHDDDRFGNGRVALAQRRDGQGQDAFVEAVGQNELLGFDAEPRRARRHDLVVARIERDVLPGERGAARR